MNLFQCIYCDQYAELIVADPVPHKARNNGIFLITVSLVMNLLTGIMVVRFLDRLGWIPDALQDLYHRLIGRGWGATLLFGTEATIVLFLLVFFIFGREDYYFRTIHAYSLMKPAEQKRVARRGARFVLLTIGCFLLAALIFWLQD